MAKVIPGRFTAQTGDPFVVFMIDMRMNNFMDSHCAGDGTDVACPLPAS